MRCARVRFRFRQAMLKMSSDPLLEIAKSLLRQRGYDADRALSRWRDVHTAQTFDSIVAQAKKVHEEENTTWVEYGRTTRLLILV